MFPVSSIGNDISSDLVRRKMNDLPESPTGNNLEALAPGIEKLKQTSIEMVTLLKEGANKRGNSSRLTQSFHFFMFEPIFSPVNALNQPI
jgi:hypothetical protein